MFNSGQFKEPLVYWFLQMIVFGWAGVRFL